MKNLLWTQLISQSDNHQFCFSVACMACGRKWTSTPKIKTGTLLTEAVAREQAAEEAMRVLLACPICGLIICQSCVVTCGDLHVCHACAAALRQHEETTNYSTAYQERRT